MPWNDIEKRRAKNNAYNHAHRERLNELARMRLQNDPELRKERNRAKRIAYRELHPPEHW